MKYRNIERLYKAAYRSIFTITGKLDYNRVTDCLIKLANTLEETETDETVWYIGECDGCGLDNLIVGAYWHYTDWHGGQYSKGYAALCALGLIFSPGMANGPETDSSEQEAYDLLNDMAEKAQKGAA